MKRRSSETALEVVERYLSEKKSLGLASCTLKDYEITLKKYVSGVELAADLDYTHFQEYTKKLLEQYKPQTVNHYLRAYGVFSNWLMEEGIIEHFKVRAVKEQEPPLKLYTEEEIEKLLKKPTHKESFNIWRSWLIVSFVMGTGARAGTLLEMKVEDIDLKAQEVIYRHTKNKKRVVIPICDNLKKCIMDYFNEFEITDYVFCGDNNTHTTINGLRHGWERFCKSRGVESKGLHALRHTYAKGFIMNGGNSIQLQKMLNHQSIRMTEHYTHIFGQDLQKATNDFSPLSKIKNESKVKRKA